MKRIKYICYYPSRDANKPRECVEAATTKIDYIISVCNRIGIAVDIISPSVVSTKSFCLSMGGCTAIGINTLRLFPSFGCHSFALLRGLSRLLTYFCFHCYLKKNIVDDETIIVYHELDYSSFFLKLKKKHNFRLIGEIEEIYQDVHPKSERLGKVEYDFFSACDNYIFSTHLLNRKLNPQGKPFVLVHGIYSGEPSRNVKWEDDDIHIIYAGTFDPIKGGALAAITSAEFLPKGYHVHICGSGKESDKAAVIRAVHETNEKTEAKVTYDGLLKGEDFICFLQKCQIGLSTQNPTAAFNATSFPSKVLTYLANGLQVVSIRIPAVEQSGLGGYLTYYDYQTPEEIAAAIVRCYKTNHVPSKEILQKLDDDFSNNLLSLIL